MKYIPGIKTSNYYSIRSSTRVDDPYVSISFRYSYDVDDGVHTKTISYINFVKNCTIISKNKENTINMIGTILDFCRTRLDEISIRISEIQCDIDNAIANSKENYTGYWVSQITEMNEERAELEAILADNLIVELVSIEINVTTTKI